MDMGGAQSLLGCNMVDLSFYALRYARILEWFGATETENPATQDGGDLRSPRERVMGYVSLVVTALILASLTKQVIHWSWWILVNTANTTIYVGLIAAWLAVLQQVTQDTTDPAEVFMWIVNSTKTYWG